MSRPEIANILWTPRTLPTVVHAFVLPGQSVAGIGFQQHLNISCADAIALMEDLPNGFVIVKNNFNLKIVKIILHRFSPFEPLNVRTCPLTVSFLNLFTSFPKPGKGSGGEHKERSENQNLCDFHIFNGIDVDIREIIMSSMRRRCVRQM